MRSTRTNHQGLAAINLGLANHISMSRYNRRTYGNVCGPYKTRRQWWRLTFWALFLCWEPHRCVTEKRWRKIIDRRLSA